MTNILWLLILNSLNTCIYLYSGTFAYSLLCNARSYRCDENDDEIWPWWFHGKGHCRRGNQQTSPEPAQPGHSKRLHRVCSVVRDCRVKCVLLTFCIGIDHSKIVSCSSVLRMHCLNLTFSSFFFSLWPSKKWAFEK